MKLSEIDATLREIRVAPVKTLGQNFLHDRNLSRWIVEKAEITKDDYVVEIGPGLGALTEFILDRGARVLAIEKDARLADFLRQRFQKSQCEIRHEDALTFDVRTLLALSNVKCVGNLPYYIASQLLLKFIAWPSPISFFLFMLQKEMAQRLSASPGTKEYGAMTVLVQSRYVVSYLRAVPASVFLPEPDVDSALVALRPRSPDPSIYFHEPTFRKLVNRGFSQRRKQLQKLLRPDVSDWKNIAVELGVASTARAEELSVAQWLALSNFAQSGPIGESTDTGSERFPVVDEEDRLVRAATRSEVHGNNLRHRAIHVFVFNGQGELFLQKRSPLKDRHPLLWDSSAAGHVDAGEDYDSAARREMMEELGISAGLLRLTKLPASDQTGQEFIWLYRARHDGPFQLAPAEIDYGAFFPPALVTQWIASRPGDFAPGFLACWKEFRRIGESNA
jgi:16S rRNA (adenine1518-N6/adenine1519-N6)-dimethyltransferase